MRAIRNSTFARSDGFQARHASNPSRAASTASATSFAPACAISASGSSVAGDTVGNHVRDRGVTSSPPMKRPYRSSKVTISRASGAGA